MGSQVNWRNLDGFVFRTTQVVQKCFVCVIHVQCQQKGKSDVHLFLRNVYYCDVVFSYPSFSLQLPSKGPTIRTLRKKCYVLILVSFFKSPVVPLFHCSMLQVVLPLQAFQNFNFPAITSQQVFYINSSLFQQFQF